jgi:hypothetical protein
MATLAYYHVCHVIVLPRCAFCYTIALNAARRPQPQHRKLAVGSVGRAVVVAEHNPDMNWWTTEMVRQWCCC